MASITKNGKVWRVQVKQKGNRLSASFPTKAECQIWAADREKELRSQRLGIDSNKTIGDVLDRYGKEVSPTKKGELWELKRISVLKTYDIANVRLSDINSTHVAKWRDLRLKDVSGSSVCRDWNLLSHAVEIARKEWKWIRHNPFKGEVTRPKVNPARDKVYTDEQIEKICHICSVPKEGTIVPKTVLQRVGYAFLFAIETGMRAGEIVALQKGDIHERFVRIRDSKNGTPRDVPLSQKAVQILSLFSKNEQVFNLNSRQLDASFRQARNNAGLQGYTFHDSRHTAITRLAKKLNVLELARMVGHKNINQLMTYYNPSASDLSEKLI